MSRKWQTLVGSQKVIDTNNLSGRGTTQFQFYAEMDALIGSRHDVNFPVTGTAKELVILDSKNFEVAANQMHHNVKVRKMNCQ